MLEVKFLGLENAQRKILEVKFLGPLSLRGVIFNQLVEHHV